MATKEQAAKVFTYWADLRFEIEKLTALQNRLSWLYEEMAKESTATPPLSAPTDGTVEKPWVWFTATADVSGESLQAVPGWLKEAITVFSKSMPLHTGVSFLAQTPTSLTLKLTWPRPMPFGETVAGRSGVAGHDVPAMTEEPR